MQLRVVLGTHGETSFTVSLNDNNFVKKWVEELKWCLTNCDFDQQESFWGLLTLEESAKTLNDSCLIINQYLKNFIDIRENPLDQNQDYFNYLHGQFERLSGKFGQPTRLFSVANKELKTAIRNLNLHVHRIEKKKETIPTLYISFNKDQYRRLPLASENYEHFDFFVPGGSLVLHYAELGKEFVDLYEDNLSLDYSNCENLHYYSGEASVYLEPYDCFADPGYVEWLKRNQIDPLDKTLGHGKIILGQVDNLADACAKIQHYRHIKNIIIEN